MESASSRRRPAAIRRFWRNRAGTTTLEYALVLALVCMAGILSYQSLGSAVDGGVASGQQSMVDTADPASPGQGFSGGSERGGNDHGRGGNGPGWGRPDNPSDAHDRGRGRGRERRSIFRWSD